MSFQHIGGIHQSTTHKHHAQAVAKALLGQEIILHYDGGSGPGVNNGPTILTDFLQQWFSSWLQEDSLAIESQSCRSLNMVVEPATGQ